MKMKNFAKTIICILFSGAVLYAEESAATEKQQEVAAEKTAQSVQQKDGKVEPVSVSQQLEVEAEQEAAQIAEADKQQEMTPIKTSDDRKKSSKNKNEINVNTSEEDFYVQLMNSLTIDQAIDFALNNNYEIQNQKAALLNASGTLRQAQASFDVKTGLSSSYNRNITPYDKDDKVTNIGGYTLYTSIQNQEFNTKAYVEKLFAFGINARLSYSMVRTKNKYVGGSYATDSYYAYYGHPNYNNQGTIALEVSIPLLKAFNSAISDKNLKAAKENYSAIEFNLQDAVCKAVMQVSEAYWKYFMATEKLKELQKMAERITVRIKNTERLVGAGVRSKNDLLRVQVNQLENNRSIDTCRIEVMSARLELAQQMGIPVDKIPDPQLQFPEIDLEKDFPAESEFTPEKVDEIALARPDIQGLKKAADAANQKWQTAKINARPDLNLNFSVGTTGAYYGNSAEKYLLSPFKNNKGVNLTGSLEFAFPVQNNAKKAEVEQSEAQYKQAKIQFDKQKNSIAMQICNAVAALNTYKETVKSAKNVLTLEEQVYNNEMKRYEAGLTTIDNLIQQDTNWINANQSYYQVYSSYLQYVLQYKYCTGGLLSLTNSVDADESENSKTGKKSEAKKDKNKLSSPSEVQGELLYQIE